MAKITIDKRKQKKIKEKNFIEGKKYKNEKKYGKYQG
jgi:hypothetical protein